MLINLFLDLFAWAPPFVQVAVAAFVAIFIISAILKILAVIMEIIPIL